MTMDIRKGSTADTEFISAQLEAFNLQHVPFHKDKMWEEYNLFAFQDEQLIGGVRASLVMNASLSIHALWVDEPYREQKIGTQILKQLETQAKAQGATMAHLDTFDFQALGFYQKNGYVVFGTLEGSPCEGHKRYYLRKSL